MKICFASKERRLEFAQEMKDRMEHPEKYHPSMRPPGSPRSCVEKAERDELPVTSEDVTKQAYAVS